MSAVRSVRFSVTGMTCASCVRHVDAALARLAGVEAVAVDLASGAVDVRFDGDRVAESALRDAILGEGYGVRFLKIAGQWRDHVMLAKLADEHR